MPVASYAMRGERQKTLNAECDGYITKPIDTEQFPLEMAQYLGAHRGGGAVP